mmetsp:Transcript_13008/g.22580  ORF Transcript_13008/g.22580 Transcript_13008/m.22580 type:complete len:88 (+) Transcript_13008:195-458(+)
MLLPVLAFISAADMDCFVYIKVSALALSFPQSQPAVCLLLMESKGATAAPQCLRRGHYLDFYLDSQRMLALARCFHGLHQVWPSPAK